MKKILLTLLYPFWFFFAKTWLGGVLLMCLIPIMPMVIFGLLLPNLMLDTKEGAADVGGGLAMLSLLLCPLIFTPLMRFGDYLEWHYRDWSYNVKSRVD